MSFFSVIRFYYHILIILAVEGPLGIEDGSITNDQITTSSYWQDENAYPGWKGRLNNTDGFWSMGEDDSAPWIQVAFSSPVTITAIQTQGANDDGDGGDGKVWVTELEIQTGDSVTTLSYIRDGSNPEVSILRCYAY